MRVFCKYLIVTLLFSGILRADQPVEGRYVVYGNGLSHIMGIAELEVYSGAENVVAGKPELFSLLCITDRSEDSTRASFRNITDGNTNTLEKWPKTGEFMAMGMGYTDASLSYCAIEADLGQMQPIERIEVYRSRLLNDGRHNKLFKDLGWRYLLVLDEARRIVSWEAWNIYHGNYKQHEGHWTFQMKPATGAPAGRVVPAGSLNWLSEAEFIRDFLGKPVVDRAAELSAADRARLERFEQRNSPEAIAELGREFFRVVDLDRPGLEEVKELVEAERYAEALEAFKAPFFETLSVLDKVYNKFEYSWYPDSNSRLGMRARDMSRRLYADKQSLSVTRFIPGLLPPAKIEFPFQMRPLLLTYVSTGDPDYLRAWEAMTDDWALGFQEAGDADPKGVRDHFVLTGNKVNANLYDLLNASRENPSFVKEVYGATLARFLMPILEEVPVANWRVTRKGVFNHVFNAVNQGWALAQATADFHAGQRLENEMRQLMQRMYTLGLYRDGPMIEIGDEGHLQGVAMSPAGLYGLLAEHPELRPDWFTPAYEAFYADRLRRSILATYAHVSPDATGPRNAPRRMLFVAGLSPWADYPDLPNSRNEYPVVAGLLKRMAVGMEAEPRAVVDRVYGWGVPAARLTAQEEREIAEYNRIVHRYHRPPEMLSDWLPYSGNWYFRGSWEPVAPYLHMVKQPLRNALNIGLWNPAYGHLGHERFIANQTGFRFRDYNTPMATVEATEIDGQSPGPHDGFIPSGSKQDVFCQGVEKPQNGRWLASERLDFGEAIYEGDYVNIYHYPPEHSKVPEGTPEWPRDERRVNDVRTVRQIIQVRPARMFLQIDRSQYATDDQTHENRIPLNLVLTEPGPETDKAFSDDQLQIDEAAQTVKVRNPGNPGFTYTVFGPEVSFQRYSINGAEYNYFPWRDPEELDPERDAVLSSDQRGKGFTTLNGPRRATGRGVFANWPATGQSLAVSAFWANKPGEEPVRHLKDLSTDTAAGGYIDQARVKTTILVAREIPAQLEIGPIQAQAEALLFIDAWRDAPLYMVLGARSLSIDGQPVTLPVPDLAFELVDGQLTNVQPIYRPLDPPTVGPAVNAFTDTTMVTLSTATPGAVIKYTTEVPESRLDEFKQVAEMVKAGQISYSVAGERLARFIDEGDTWQLYTGPFEISEDTLVRARTFRTGDEAVPTLLSAGTEVSDISYGFFHREPMKADSGGLFRRFDSGLEYDYLEERWFALWTYTDQLEVKATGTTEELLDVSMRQTDGPFAVRYHGYLDVPADGVYTFYAPPEFINNEAAPGYDLRLFIDGEEWDLSQVWHARGTWSVPLEAGPHRFRVTFADARAKDIENQRVDLWGSYPEPETTWRGTAPMIEVSGPNVKRQPIPNTWLKH